MGMLNYSQDNINWQEGLIVLVSFLIIRSQVVNGLFQLVLAFNGFGVDYRVIGA